MKYVSVSPFWVIEEIEKGREIHCIDKESKEVFILNDLDVGSAVVTLKDAKAHSDKYDFWYEEEGTESDNG